MPSSNMATATIFTRPPHIWGWWHWRTDDCVNLPNLQRKFVQLPNIGGFYYAKLTQIGLKVYYNPNPTPPAMAQQPPQLQYMQMGSNNPTGMHSSYSFRADNNDSPTKIRLVFAYIKLWNK